MNDVMKVIKDDSLAIISQAFDNNCSMQVSVRKAQVNQTMVKFNKLNIAVKYDHTS